MRSCSFLTSLPIAIFIIWLSACDDSILVNLAPETGVLTVNNKFPSDIIEVDAGGSLVFSGEFSDDIELKRYTITISHTENDVGENILSFNREIDLSGLQQKDQQHIAIPIDTRAGAYTFRVHAEDKARIRSEFVDFELIINNPGMPEITLSSPSEGSSFLPGDTLQFSGSITDGQGLSSIRVLVEPMDKARRAIYDASIDLATKEVLDADLSEILINAQRAVIPQTSSISEHYVRVIATDVDKHTAISYKKIKVVP